MSTKLDQIVYNKDQQIARSAGDLFDGELNNFRSVVNNTASSAQDLANSFSSVKEKLNGIHPRDIAKTLKRSVEKVADSPEKQAFLEAVEANKNNQQALQSIVAQQGRALLDRVPETDK